VLRVMGHAKVSITLDIYADIFDSGRHADEISRCDGGFRLRKRFGGKPT
jgi:hypothetical protein